MKKRSLLLSVLAVCFIGMQASDLKSVWSHELTLPREWKNAAGNDLVAMSATNDVYVAGVFKGELEFAGEILESDFNSTYLLKYNADGTEAWALAFFGAVTPTAITVAEDGSVYVAGTLADQVTMGSTGGQTQVIDGVQDGGSYVAYQSAAFIARYSADGVLQKVRSYKPQVFEELSESGYNRDGARIHIAKLEKQDDKLIAALTIGGVYDDGTNRISGGYTSLDFGDGFFPLLDVTSGYVLSFDNELMLNEVYAELRIADGQEINYNVNSATFATVEDRLFTAFSASGKMVLKVKGTSSDIEFASDLVDGETYPSRGAVLAEIVLSDGALTKHVQWDNTPISNGQSQDFVVNSMDVKGGNLVLTGTFANSLPFDKTITGDKDIVNAYVSAIAVADLTVATAHTSSHAGSELWASCAVSGDSVYVAANDTVGKTGSVYLLDMRNASEALRETSSDNAYVNALASNGAHLAKVEAVSGADESAVLRISLLSAEPSESGVNEVIDHTLTFYPNPVKSTLYLNKASDVQIYNLSGVVVAQAANARQINLEALTPGSYIVAAKNSDGVQRLPFIKE